VTSTEPRWFPSAYPGRVAEPEGAPPRSPRPPGQIIGVVLLLIGAALLLFVCVRIADAFG